MSQRQVGLVLNKSRSFVSRVERGTRSLSDAELIDYLRAIKSSIETYRSLLHSVSTIQKYKMNYTQDDVVEGGLLGGVNSKDEVLRILKDYFADKPVKDAYLFGSFAREEQQADSDIDIYVTLEETKKVSIYDIARYKIDLTKSLGKPIDIVVAGSEYDFVKTSLEQDKVLVK